MTIARFLRSLPVSLCLGILMLPAAKGETVGPMPDGPTGGSFTVHDGRAPDEVSESTRLYLNGHLAAIFHLDLAHADDSAVIPLPLGRVDIPYTLCGTVTVMHDGKAETRDVSGDGVLHNPDGHYFEAVGSENFRDFFLMDENDPAATDHHNGNSSRCLSSNS
ncbi:MULTISPECIES: hypothetical protein [Acetobacteraceae]|nr:MULTISPECIES: hypothetical protein [Acetobacteraceae]